MAGRSGRTTRQPGPWKPGPPPRGNTWHLVHGADSPRAIAAKAQQVHDELLTIAPYLAEEKFLPSVDRYLRAAAREALLDDHITAVSASKGTGAVPECDEVARLERGTGIAAGRSTTRCRVK